MVKAARIRTNMDIRPMPTDAPLILAQWLSPAYPVGAFSYSHGLETAIQDGVVRTALSLECWLMDVLCHGTGLSEAILVAAAYDAQDGDEVMLVDATARAFVSSAERLRESVLQGAAFARTASAIHDLDLPELTYPVAVGRAARLFGLPLPLTQSMYLQSVMSNLVSAAVRLVPLGQTEGQAVLSRLTPICAETVDKADGQTLDDLSSAAFLSDIAAMRHETLKIRLFRS